MRKLVIFFQGVPDKIRKIANKVLQYTTAILYAMDRIANFLEGDIAKEITALIPGDEDEALRLALIAAFRVFEKPLRAARNRYQRKLVMGDIGAHVTAQLDGAQHGADVYKKLFDKVYNESKIS